MSDSTQQQIQALEEVIADSTTTERAREFAQEKLAALRDPKPQVADSEFSSLVQELGDLRTAIGDNSSITEEAVETLIDKEISGMRVELNQLAPDVVDMIRATQSITLVNFENFKVTVAGAQRRLWDVILSDVEAGNNTYLYGGAGTGKTFMAKQIAKALNYRLYTINCNQFTSKLDILGGQTIEGYQEGVAVEAWGNLNMGVNSRTKEPYSGALLLLDELPKIDPNSAGLLNDLLSTLKDPRDQDAEGNAIPPVIQNGRGEAISLGNLYIIATGNSKLNEADKDYEANFKQDLSLQDRFGGSTYQIFIDYSFELNGVMRNISWRGTKKIINLTFIFNFLAMLRNAINELGFEGRAFVSTRTMVSFRDTYMVFRQNTSSKNPIPRVKTLADSIASFLSLFTEQQQAELR